MTQQPIDTNFEYYKVFYYVVKTGSLTAAAERLCLTQPTVTKAIQKLEEQLSCRLFIRSKRGVQLTEEGRILWKRAEPACSLLMAAQQELESVRRLDGGSLSIASTEMSFRAYVLPALERFTRDYPNVKVRFRNALTESILDMLRREELDLAILHMPFPSDARIDARTIGRIEECFVAGARFAFLAERRRSVRELWEYPFVSVPEGSGTKRYTREIFLRHGLEYEPDIEVTTIELVVHAVRSNFGIAMLPWQYVRESVERGELFRIPVELPKMERETCILTPKGAAQGYAAGVFIREYLQPEMEKDWE